MPFAHWILTPDSFSIWVDTKAGSSPKAVGWAPILYNALASKWSLHPDEGKLRGGIKFTKTHFGHVIHRLFQ